MIFLETMRLIVRDHRPEDIDGVHALLSNKRNTHFIQDLRTGTLDESRDNLFEAIKQSTYDNRVKFFFAIEEKETGSYVGEVGYTITARAKCGAVAEMGYFILKAYWGKGYVTEAVKEVLKYGFTQGGLVKIETGCNKMNTASERVMIKCGMIKEGEFVNHSMIDGKLYNRVCYRLLKSEWSSIDNNNSLLTKEKGDGSWQSLKNP